MAKMAEEGEYGTTEYLDGKMMTDLHVDADAERQACDRPPPDARFPLSGLERFGRRRRRQHLPVAQTSLGSRSAAASRPPLPVCMPWSGWGGVVLTVVLSDVVMPDMDGYELYQTVKKNTPELPVVLMTAFNYDKDHIIKRSCLDGLQGVIFKKPVNPMMLKKVLLQQCRPEPIPPPAAP